MIFSTQKTIRFQHCDPAGIVFYPRFYGLLHEAQEDWLSHMGFAEHDLIASGVGVPVVSMKTDFLGMCRFGESVNIDLDLWKLGNSSVGMRYCLYSIDINKYAGKPHISHEKMPESGTHVRLRAQSVVVYSQVPQGKAVRIPDALRAAMTPYLNAE